VFVVHLLDRHKAHGEQERAQAEQVAGWLIYRPRDYGRRLGAYVRNGSKQPIYSITWEIYNMRSDSLNVVYNMRSGSMNVFDCVYSLEPILTIPPETTRDSWLNQTATREILNDGDLSALCVSLTFRDARGREWERDPRGILRRRKLFDIKKYKREYNAQVLNELDELNKPD
jgi:hypothetical protein